jgi:hypothetical protein
MRQQNQIAMIADIVTVVAYDEHFACIRALDGFSIIYHIM